jgi:hypothetical protein
MSENRAKSEMTEINQDGFECQVSRALQAKKIDHRFSIAPMLDWTDMALRPLSMWH